MVCRRWSGWTSASPPDGGLYTSSSADVEDEEQCVPGTGVFKKIGQVVKLGFRASQQPRRHQGKAAGQVRCHMHRKSVPDTRSESLASDLPCIGDI